MPAPSPPPYIYTIYTSRGHGCGIYSALAFGEGITRSKLGNSFSNTAIGKTQPLEIRNHNAAKYFFQSKQFLPESA